MTQLDIAGVCVDTQGLMGIKSLDTDPWEREVGSKIGH